MERDGPEMIWSLEGKRMPIHQCPTCTPKLWVNRPPICPKCGADMPGADHHDKWANDVCDNCDKELQS